MTLASDASASRCSTPSRLATLAGAAMLLAVAGCASPGQGPSSVGVATSTAFANPDIPVIDLNRVNIAQVNDGGVGSFARLGGGSFRPGQLRPGDKVQVRIFDTGEQGLLSSADAKALELGIFQIDAGGFVNLPYAGRIRASGLTAASLQDAIAAKLKGSSVAPQATVLVTEAEGSGYTVNGAVNSAGQFTLGGQRTNVLEAIAKAGGPLSPAGETEVTLIRGSGRQTVSMDRLIADSRQNVAIQPGDQIFVRKTLTSFTSFGAFKSPGEFRFEPGELTMAQAVARSGGLLDDRANPERVYLFRQEPAQIARSAGVIKADDPRSGLVPVAYQVDMTHTQSFFLMQSIQMKKGDVLYVPNTGNADFGKIFQVFQKTAPTAAAPLPN